MNFKVISFKFSNALLCHQTLTSMMSDDKASEYFKVADIKNS